MLRPSRAVTTTIAVLIVVVSAACTRDTQGSPEQNTGEQASPQASPAAQLREGKAGALSRAQAKTLLDRNPSLAVPVPTLPATQGAVEGGIAEGLLQSVGVWPAAVPRLELTAEGANFFRSVAGQPNSFNGPFAQFELLTPATRAVVEVSGITDAVLPNVKEVHFTWEYRGLPDVVARLTGHGATPHSGVALVRQYDDGWRIEQLDASKENRVPYRSDSQRVQAAQAVRQAGVDRFNSATTPTKVVAEIKIDEFPPGASPRHFLVVITDADVTILNPSRNDAGLVVGFWEIEMSYSPSHGSTRRPQLVISKARLQGRVTLDVDPKDQALLEEAHRKISEAYSSWKQRFPDVR